ncbi:MAG: hypothetical protein CVU05_14135 [Bacteroidetes bacterium HGW-Bacteroidetes-21]|jgi:signal transduction histidine kinase|nr:MAG: hypothetical protein CVU05_14135 [Bacteroidetes bacterium HGW-Bacteroidetes-21]
MEEISDKLEQDYILQELSKKPYENQERVFKYLRENYLYRFWSKYDIQTTLCGPWDNLKFQQNSKVYPCFQYFDRIVSENSIEIEGTKFYYVDNGNGRISYLGVFEYNKGADTVSNKLFIELNSKLVTHVLGYPDILVDESLKKIRKLEDYSYAFYREGKLVSATGKFQYYLTSRLFEGKFAEFSEVLMDGYDHLIYRPDTENLLVLTSKKVTFYNYITLFSYLFTIFSLFFLMYLLLVGLRHKSFRQVISVKQRIRVAFLSVFLLSLIMLGSVTIYYMLEKYRDKHQEVISEKIQSVLVELNHKLGQKENLSATDLESVTSLLIKFSNVFYTDIHLYDKNGVLYSSSRNEVFSKGIFGTMMNPTAYYEMVSNMRMEYVHTENIGSLQYYSGYVPFFNHQGKLLAYLNLPYFTRQADLTKDVSDFIVAVINIFLVLFMVGIWLTIWLSDSLTRPLAMIQQKLQKVSLGKRNEPIHYHRMDEIGALVSEYNRMLDELAQSAEMLAESERERAWREMAKQIAHEIKNPLTPMKISIQYLQKAHAEKMPDWEGMIDKVSKTLIEQIDSLSVIASEFSTFARMPVPKLERVNLVELGKSLLPLYEHIGNLDIVLNIQNEEELWILADKEHVLRMFNNLLKNSIQAIPQDVRGEIKIEMTGYPQEVMVKISDNGTGIPAEIQDKLYTPNFTTKSSGMGLGLAIVKKIVEGMNGSIRFVTAVNQGTTFFIEFPKAV